MSSPEKKIYLISGDDEFAVKNKSRAIIASLCGDNFEENPALEIIHGDSDEKANPSKLMGDIAEAIATPPFLSSEKIVWIKNFDFEIINGKSISAGKRTKKEEDGEKQGGKAFERLVEIINNGPPEGTRIVMSIFGVDKRSKIYKACQKNAEIFDFEKIGLDTKNLQEILSGHIDESCRELGLKILPEARSFIIEACGASHSRITNEIEKIASFIHPRNEATLEDCLQICSMTPEMASWAFSDAIGRKDLPAAMKALDILLTPKNPEISILYSLINLFSDMAQINAVSDEIGIKNCFRYPDFDQKVRNCPAEAKSKFGWSKIFSMNPYRAFKLYEQCSKIQPQMFAYAFRNILNANRSLVSGAVNPRLELENLAIKLCAKNLA